LKYLRLLLIGFYLFAGSYYFINPEFYLVLIPDYFPFPEFINYASGLIEILLSIGVAVPKYRTISVYGILVLLVLFIHSHVYFIKIGACIENGLCVTEWIAWLRLLVIHPLLMYWAWVVRK
jgi:uncharacterized membrane protein